MPKVDIFLGAQWGDEGKGKIIDAVSKNYVGVVRYQGGDNAGHTLYVNGKKLVLHLIPSGILHDEIHCHLATNVVINPESLLKEIEEIKTFNINYQGRLTICPDAKIIFPFHIQLDKAREAQKGQAIGTTGKGIGPAYEDTSSRRAITIGEFVEETPEIEARIKTVWQEKKSLIESYGETCISFEELSAWRKKYVSFLKPFLLSNEIYFSKMKDKLVLCEGAQGVLLDLHQGTYPMVTSSQTGVAGCLSSTGLSHKNIRHVYGIAKAYTTRVGGGAFPSELHDEIGEKIQTIGKEFGATTGRKRRCGWLDLVILKKVVESQGMDYLCLTKADILNGFSKVGLVTKYENGLNGSLANKNLENKKAITEQLDCWSEADTKDRNFKNFVDKIEKCCGIPIKYIGTGPNREDLIER